MKGLCFVPGAWCVEAEIAFANAIRELVTRRRLANLPELGHALVVWIKCDSAV